MSRMRLSRISRASTYSSRTKMPWWVSQIPPIVRKLVANARYPGHSWTIAEPRCSKPSSGIASSSTSSVIAIAKTPSLNASVRLVAHWLPTATGSRRRAPSPASADGEQVHHEHERLVGLDHAAGATGAVRHRRRDRQLAAAADLHALDARVPALDDLALAEPELEGLAAVPRR